MLKITAYSDTISCRGGDTVDVKVSAEGGITTFNADLRRIVQGDMNPAGPGYRDELVPLDMGGPFRARKQEIRTGSYGCVSSVGKLPMGSFTIAAMVWPTMPGTGEQTLISAGNVCQGWRLFLNERGCASFEVSSDDAVVSVCSSVPCRDRAWYFISGTFDTEKGFITVDQIPLKSFPGMRDAGTGRSDCPVTLSIGQDASILFAARLDSHGRPESFFNGKIEAPELYRGVEDATNLFRIIQSDALRSASLVAKWDFADDMQGDTFSDGGPHSLSGRFFNLPHRAVSGFRWNGDAYRFSERPEHYAAVHFHDDDLYDAGWQVDFSVKLPADLLSGVYAVRLFSQDDPDAEYFVVFCVKPASGAQKKDVVFIMPTASYMAYANHRLGIDISETEIGAGQLLQMDRHHLHLQAHPEVGLSLYEVHRDGSGVFYSSRLRPVLDFQPKVQGFIGGLGSNIWQFNADTHILGFLEQRGIGYDVLTDEDLDKDGVAALDGYRVVVTGTHPEYTSTRMLDAYESFLDRGGRVMSLGGNGFYWRIAYSDRLPGVIECRRAESGIRGWEPGTGNYWHQFTGELGGLWRRIGRAPQQIFGVGMTAQGFDLSSPYIRTHASRDARAEFIFRGVDGNVIGDFGLNGNGAAGNEIDRADFALGTPPHALILASSHEHTDVYLALPEDMLDPTPTSTGTQCHLIRADLTFFETNGGGAVFSTGSIAWAGAMAWNRYDNEISTITENVLRRFMEPESFSFPE
ncbi:N,N-dimethylformamidase beta subunit family domain-containing protein [Burkholderia cenocepacia]|uniref:N,N-dimethylformamidase beta subunit family domain-containing protein n=1 Tax=Burkholderia cenocepacia TaxID=95486 RepID=UPI00264B3A29|nr:N,N-dimethylformamidase beta subunit family domain-containing protein [Burkholderia cenocepacia]MDN7631588.1 large subunit of N,N-dimethylformamidase [Burkholderia cenocepacia]